MTMATAFDKAFEAFANWQTLIFCLGLYLLTYVGRTITEYAWKGAKTSPLYNELILPLAPLTFGAVIALIARKYPWPVAIANTVTGKMMYGAFCGYVSAKVYARLMVWLNASAENGNPLAQKLLKVTPTQPAAPAPAADTKPTPVNPDAEGGD